MRTTTLVALALLTLTGCPDPLEDCQWGASDVGAFQQYIDADAGTCLASNVDTMGRIVVSGPMDIRVEAATTEGATVEIDTLGGRVAVLTDATDQFPGVVCFYTPVDIAEGSCDAVRLACETHDGLEPGAVERPSTFLRYIVNGEEVDYLQVVAESFAVESGLIR